MSPVLTEELIKRMLMRLFSLLAVALFLSACVFTPEMAPLLQIPAKPAIKKQQAQITYQLPKANVKLKSVQLPAHKISKQDKIMIDFTHADTKNLKNKVITLLKNKSMQLTTDETQAKYKLSLNKYSITKGDDINAKRSPLTTDHAVISQTLNKNQTCSTYQVNLSFRLTHIKSGDVVWFARGGLNSAGFSNNQLVYQVNINQSIENELKIVNFINKQNTQQARIERFKNPVEIPEYQVVETPDQARKISGYCADDEVQQLTPDITNYLAKALIQKLKLI